MVLTPSNNFSGGELSPKLRGRPDIPRYNSGCSVMENFIVHPQGPAQVRPGTQWVAETKDATKRARLLPYILAETRAYVVEMGNLYMRFCRNDGTGPAQLLDAGSPVEIVSPYLEAELRDVQSAQVITSKYMVQGNHAPRKLIRVSDTNWSIAAVNFRPAPTAEIPIAPDRIMTLNALTGTGKTLTLSGAGSFTFLNGDITRVITAGTGRASIVGYTSPTVVIVDIIDDFDALIYQPDDWLLIGSPFAEMTPSRVGPVGGIVTLNITGDANSVDLVQTDVDWVAGAAGSNEWYLLNTASSYSAVEPDRVRELGDIMEAGTVGSLSKKTWDWGDNDALGYNTIYVKLTDAGDPNSKFPDTNYLTRGDEADVFRSTDVGKYSRIDGIGFVQITSYVSSIEVKGEVLKLLDAALPTFDWTLEDPVWSDTLGWPQTITLQDDRLFFAATITFPQTVWASKVADYENFTPGANDSDAFTFTLGGDQVNAIQWMKSRNALLIGTEAAEWAVRPSGAVLTPSDISAKEQTTNGSERIQPINIDGSIFFVKRKGTKLPELSYEFASDGYIAPDRTILADHITAGGIKEIAYAQEPIKTLHSVRDDGELLGFTYIKDEGVVAWMRQAIAGEIESVAVVPHPTENYDEVWVETKRDIDGNDVRYIEVFAKLFDSADPADAWQVDAGIPFTTPVTTITGLDHLEGETVQVVSGGSIVGEGYVVSGGEITLDKETTASGIVGLAFTATLRKMPMTVGQFAASIGLKKTVKYARVELYRTIGGKIGFDPDTVDPMITQSMEAVLDDPPDLLTGQVFMTLPGEYNETWELTIVQDQPLPMTVLAVIPDGEMSDAVQY